MREKNNFINSYEYKTYTNILSLKNKLITNKIILFIIIKILCFYYFLNFTEIYDYFLNIIKISKINYIMFIFLYKCSIIISALFLIMIMIIAYDLNKNNKDKINGYGYEFYVNYYFIINTFNDLINNKWNLKQTIIKTYDYIIKNHK